MDAHPEVGVLEQAASSSNGRNMNGRNMNGRNMNGRNMNGTDLNGQDTGAILNGVKLLDATYDGKTTAWPLLANSLLADASAGVELPTGTSLRVEALDGTTFTLTIATHDLLLDSSATTADTNEDAVHAYDLTFVDSNGETQSLCGYDDNGLPVLAIALAGRWLSDGGYSDDGSVTFACRRYALAKCVELGYKPWTDLDGVETKWGEVGEQSLGSYHRACVRMIRADYCGDGVSHTKDGMLINVYDRAGVQLDTEAWLVEAEWNENGASCVSEKNLDAIERHRGVVPDCVARTPTCGEEGYLGYTTLLVNEFTSLNADLTTTDTTTDSTL